MGVATTKRCSACRSTPTAMALKRPTKTSPSNCETSTTRYSSSNISRPSVTSATNSKAPTQNNSKSPTLSATRPPNTFCYTMSSNSSTMKMTTSTTMMNASTKKMATTMNQIRSSRSGFSRAKQTKATDIASVSLPTAMAIYSPPHIFLHSAFSRRKSRQISTSSSMPHSNSPTAARALKAETNTTTK